MLLAGGLRRPKSTGSEMTDEVNYLINMTLLFEAYLFVLGLVTQ